MDKEFENNTGLEEQEEGVNFQLVTEDLVEPSPVEPEPEVQEAGCLVEEQQISSTESENSAVQQEEIQPEETAQDVNCEEGQSAKAWNDVPKYDYYTTQSEAREQNFTSNQTESVEGSKKSAHAPRTHKKGTRKWGVAIALAAVFGIVASSTFQLGNYAWSRILKEEEIEQKKILTTQITSASGQSVQSDVADIAEQVMPSVVSITNLSVQQVQSFFYGIQEQESTSAGSGIIIGKSDTELLIVTNNHVIEDSRSLTVSFSDDSSYEAVIKGKDANKDIAVVAVPLENISDETMASIKVATVGDSSALRVGEQTIAIGNALGIGQSVTSGIVSALDREIDDIDVKLIQTDAAINPGNSGGALLNSKGEVIGINTAKVSDSQVEGMGYAIPISEVSELIETLMNRVTRTEVQEFERGYLGIYGATFSDQMAELYDLPEGVFVKELVQGGAAELSGIKVGNIITKFDGISISSMEDLQGELKYYRAGEMVTVTVQQVTENGTYEEKDIQVTLGKQSE